MSQMGLSNHSKYHIVEVFDGADLGYLSQSNPFFTCRVNPTGVYLIKATLVKIKTHKHHTRHWINQILEKIRKKKYHHGKSTDRQTL